MQMDPIRYPHGSELPTTTTTLPDYRAVTSDYTRLLLVLYCLIALFIGIPANIFITYSTMCYRSIRMDRWGLILTRNLAIADGLYAVFVMFPVLVNNLTKGWTFGTVLCSWLGAMKYFFMLASTNFLTAVSLHRMIQGLNPLRDYMTTTKHSVAISLLIWLYSFIVPIRLLMGSSFPAVFNPDTAFCKFSGFRSSCENFIFSIVMLLIPFCVIIVSHLVLYYVSKMQLLRQRRRRKQSRKADTLTGKEWEKRGIRRTVTTLGSLSALICISWLPNIMKHWLPVRGETWRPFRRAVMYLYFLNTTGNPVLYTLVNRDFKNYARRQIASAISKEVADSSGKQRTCTARLSPLSVGSNSYLRPVKSSII